MLEVVADPAGVAPREADRAERAAAGRLAPSVAVERCELVVESEAVEDVPSSATAMGAATNAMPNPAATAPTCSQRNTGNGRC